MRYRIRHTTRYRYQDAVVQCHNLAHLLPRNTPYQQCLSSDIQVTPMPVTAIHRSDYFGNNTYHFSVQTPHHVLEITANSDVDIIHQRQNLSLDFGSTCGDVTTMLKDDASEKTTLAKEFSLNSPMVKVAARLAEYAAPSFQAKRPFLSAVRELTARIHQDFVYDPRATDVATPLAEVMDKRSGVCQDFAHLAIGSLRSLGYPARYVSGYLETEPAPGETKLAGADASHAWFAVYSPTEGWCDFDPTNDMLPSYQHITTAWGRDYADVTPVKGTVIGGGAEHQLEVEVDVLKHETIAV